MPRKRQQPTTSQTVTSGSVIRIESPSSNRQKKTPIAQVVVQEFNPTKGFIDFLREHAIVGLAVGFAIGSQAQTLIKQLVTSFVDPLYDLLFGKALTQRTFTWHFHGRSQAFGWGAFAHSLLIFLFVLLFIYLILRWFSLDDFDRPKKKT